MIFFWFTAILLYSSFIMSNDFQNILRIEFLYLIYKFSNVIFLILLKKNNFLNTKSIARSFGGGLD